MKRLTILFFAIITSTSAFCQAYIQDGDRCFDSGDYACAITNYDNAFKNTKEKDKQIAEIKLTRAKWCADQLKIANQAFSVKNYKEAIETYQSVLESNPKDLYAKTQVDKCGNLLNNPTASKLRKATMTDLADIWNNKYGVMPARSQKLIDAGIDPVDAQKRINAGEGKPTNEVKQEKTLRVSKTQLSFTSSGGSETVTVSLKSFSISLIPTWCSVQKYSDYFIVTCNANYSNQSRSDWFNIRAGDNELKIVVNQSAAAYSSVVIESNTPIKNRKYFNCPKAKYTFGITAGYVQKYYDYTEGFQLGLRVEPLFKYGFGINTGINFEGYSTNLSFVIHGEEEFKQYALNIPLHLEYRLNFSKWFNIFAYGGPGLNIVTSSLFEEYSIPTTFEYGGGLRINHLQFNAGQSMYMGNLRDIQDFGIYRELYQNLIFSVSYMF
jgi:tetratricopeptide (TPR) repeat protein